MIVQNHQARHLTTTLPENFEQAVSLTREEVDQQIRLMAALKMFELGKISSGKAAELAGMSRVEFLDTCGRYRVSVFNYLPDELEKELQSELNGQADTANAIHSVESPLLRAESPNGA